MKSIIKLLLVSGVAVSAWGGMRDTPVEAALPDGQSGTPTFSAMTLSVGLQAPLGQSPGVARHNLWTTENPLSLNSAAGPLNPQQISSLWTYGAGLDNTLPAPWSANDLSSNVTKDLRNGDSQTVVIPLPGAALLAILGLGAGSVLRRAR